MNLKSDHVSYGPAIPRRSADTWRNERVVFGKGHDGFEIAPVVQRVGIQDNQGNVPAIDIIVVKLRDVRSCADIGRSRPR
jgi:hypothetical protein